MKDNLITLAHGGGGQKTHFLVKDIMLRYLGNRFLEKLDDSACIEFPGMKLAFTTDSYVVDPVFFPGGDIGKLAACGTINDLVMQGAKPEFLSLGLIIEEGFLLSDLEKIIKSMSSVLQSTGAMIVAGDTKVVQRGKGNGIFINTAGIGRIFEGIDVHISNARPNDAVIISGTLGDHGMAVMSQREGIKFESTLTSDVNELYGLIKPLLDEIPEIHCLRDPTRGGLASAAAEMAEASNTGIRLQEQVIPIKSQVKAACKLLGLDPLNVANEGKAVIVCPQERSKRALDIIRSHTIGKDAQIIGKIVSDHRKIVVLETKEGGERIVEMPSGEDLPRIC